MVVATSTSMRPSMKPSMAASRASSVIWAWPTPTRASGTSSRMRAATVTMESTRLCTTYTWPPRRSSNWMAVAMSSSDQGATTVSMARRFLGGVSMRLISRSPVRLMWRVRGMGVALMASTSTLARIFFSRSLWLTPKRCSSSMTTRPRSLNFTRAPSSWWVPMTISTFPASTSWRMALASAASTNRLSISMRMGKAEKRSLKVRKCWKHKMVVGHSTATCLPSRATLAAARMATSVLPKPTSPHRRRSMGTGRSRSALMASVASIWSGVGSKGKVASNSAISGPSGG